MCLGGEHLARLDQARGQPCQDGLARGTVVCLFSTHLRAKSIVLLVPRAMKVPAALDACPH